PGEGGGGGGSLPVVDKLEGWWDATDISTLFQDTAGTTPVQNVGDPVALWVDKSPGVTTIAGKKPWNFWQENQSRRPAWHDTSMGGAPTLHLNEQCCDDGMKIHNAGGNPNFMPNDSIRDNSTVIVVDRYWGGTRGRTVMSGTGNNWLMNKWSNNNAMHGDGGWVSDPGHANAAIPLDVPFIGVWTRGGGQAKFYGSGPGGVFDQDFTTNPGIGGTPGTLAIGIEGNCCGGEQSQADIAEILVYDKVLSTEERQAVEAYLVDKYADDTPAVPNTGGGGGGAVEELLFEAAQQQWETQRNGDFPDADPGASLSFSSDGHVIPGRAGGVSGPAVFDVQVINTDVSPGPGGVSSELAVWIDASDINGNFVEDSVEGGVINNGDLVDNWKDKSGNNHNFNRVRRGDPNYVANSIANGKPTVNFDGDDILQIDPAGEHNPRNFINSNGEFTLITVARYTGGDSERVIATSTGHNWLAGFHGNGYGRWHYDGWGSLDVGGHNRDENFHIHSNQMNVNGDGN
ncbi:MAG: hypothetical protein VB853_10780, partial [Pirellulales bacterium]